MDIDKEIADLGAEPAKKPPRKPRPSEIAAKKAKAAKKKKPAVRKRKPAPKKKKPSKPKAKKAAKRGRKVPAGQERSERVDCRLTKAQKAKLMAKARKMKCHATDLIMKAIDKIK